jgi:hypothetical protein
MSFTAEQCYDKARDCTLKALKAKDGEAKAEFFELAREWKELARQIEETEWNRLK